jgi:hypothetical protein
VFGPQRHDTSLVRRFLTTRVMVYLGVISYGIYLWHEPWIDRYLSWTNLRTFTVYGSDTPFAWHTSPSRRSSRCCSRCARSRSRPRRSSWFALERPVLKLKRLGQSKPALADWRDEHGHLFVVPPLELDVPTGAVHGGGVETPSSNPLVNCRAVKRLRQSSPPSRCERIPALRCGAPKSVSCK